MDKIVQVAPRHARVTVDVFWHGPGDPASIEVRDAGPWADESEVAFQLRRAADLVDRLAQSEG